MRDERGEWLVINDALRVPMSMSVALPFMKDKSVDLVLEGNWQTADGLRRFDVTTGHFVSEPPAPAMRIAMFFTDGYVGDEGKIIQMIRENAGTTRVFGLGICTERPPGAGATRPRGAGDTRTPGAGVTRPGAGF